MSSGNGAEAAELRAALRDAERTISELRATLQRERDERAPAASAMDRDPLLAGLRERLRVPEWVRPDALTPVPRSLLQSCVDCIERERELADRLARALREMPPSFIPAGSGLEAALEQWEAALDAHEAARGQDS